MYSKAVLYTHVFVPKTEISNINAVRNSLTFRSRYDSSIAIPTYKETEKWFGFPRHSQRLGDSFADETIDKRTEGSRIEHVFNFEGELWDYQMDAMKEFVNELSRGGTGFFLEAAPGSGKTVIGIRMLTILGKKALIIVPKSDLVEQWRQRLIEYTDIRPERIGVAANGKVDWEDKDVVVGLVHTVVLNRWGGSFMEHFGTILFDECDSSVPPTTFSPIASMFPAKYRIGMTASASRTDGLHRVFEEHICQYRIVCKKSNTMAPTVIVHYYHKSSGAIPTYIEAKMSRRGVLISKLASNPERNKLIAAYTFKSYMAGRPTLVISDRKDQLKAIFNILVHEYNIPGFKIGYYVRTLDGKTIKKKDKEHTAESCAILLGTYGMIKRGTDIQRLSTLILATPQTDLRQTQGRIERVLGGKAKPIVIDIVDSVYPECIVSSNYRLKQYKNAGLTIKKRGLNETP